MKRDSSASCCHIGINDSTHPCTCQYTVAIICTKTASFYSTAATATASPPAPAFEKRGRAKSHTHTQHHQPTAAAVVVVGEAKDKEEYSLS
jgi:hypothetical protein